MQGDILMPHSPPPNINKSSLVTEMEVTPPPSSKDLINQSDSGIFSSTTLDLNRTSDNCDTDTRSDCSSPERKYVCPICDRMLTSQHDFTLHIRSHNNESEIQDNENGYTCRICNKVLSSSSSLDRHVLVHSGERPFHCKYCGDTFTTNGNMHRHMRTHSQKSSDNYESDGSVDSNLSSTKSIEYNNNNKVDLKLSNKRKLEHSDNSTNKRREICSDNEIATLFKCPVCERDDFNSISNMETHLEDNHPEYPAKCSDCKQVFLNNKLLTAHKATVHESPSNKHPVVGFKNLSLLNFPDFSSNKFPHVARRECELNRYKVASGLKFQCKSCMRAFPCVNSLEMHEIEKSCIPSGENCNGLDLSKCNSISDTFKRMDFFSRLDLHDNSPEKPLLHLSTETSIKLKDHLVKSICNIDNTKDLADIQSILTNINLQQSKTISNKSNYEISPSDSSKNEQEEESQDLFAVEFRKMKLRGEFPCRLCTAVFPNLRALKGHNRAHLNGNNNGTYHCNMCPHSSIDKAALIRHMRTHNGDRPYECSLCNYAFTTKANCERHLRNRHAKSTREEVKKSIIYHPSEDPTNEDLNKLTTKDDSKKLNLSTSTDASDITPEKLHCSTPKISDHHRSIVAEELLKPIIPDLQSLKPNIFINDIIRNENLRSIKEHKLFQNNATTLFQQHYKKLPSSNESLAAKIQVKSMESLKMGSSYYSNNNSDDEYADEEEQPMDLVLDLSKKKPIVEEKKFEEVEAPQDLTKKSPPITPQLNMGELFAPQMKLDPAALYAAQLARLYHSAWPGFHLNPLLLPAIPSPAVLSPNLQDMKERGQRYQLCGGSVVPEELKNFQMQQQQTLRTLNGFKMDNKPMMDNAYSKKDELKPLSLNVDNAFPDLKLQSPSQNKSDMMQSPNSVKMVIKNGVLMPKQKQRRYRTERPFTCEHCSARFTLRSNMERHIKQQHPQFWSQRQRGNVGNPGRKSHGLSIKSNYCDLSIPNYEIPKTPDYDETKEQLKLAILAQQLKASQTLLPELKKEDDDECALVIDENEEKNKTEELNQRFERTRILEEKLTEYQKHHKQFKNEEDLVPVSRLLDNASQQQFKEYFKRESEEQEVGGVSEEDEEGLVASGSTSEGNVSGTDENRSESEIAAPAKKKSAYSLAPNRVSCPYCSRKFPWTSSLRRHILTHTGQKPFKCSHCPLLFTTKSNCDRHLLRKHGNSATTITNETSNNNGNFLIRNVPERPFKCSNCPSSTFSTYSNLKKHISCKHSTNAQGDDIKAQGYEAGSSEDEKIVLEGKNDWENQLTYNKLNNEVQMQVQNSDLPFKCHLCEGSFSERQDALDHIRDKHASEYDLLMSKNALDSNATTPDDASHQDDEESEIRGKFPDYSNRKVICAFCMRRFWSAEDLRRHMRTHTGERPFSCDICRRRFTLKHSMLRHRKKHNVSFENDNVNSDEEAASFDKFVNTKSDNNNLRTDESDGNEGGGDLISNLLGIRDRSIIDKVLGASADDAAKLLGMKNGVKE